MESSYKFDILQYIPREYIITSKNGTSYFNKEMMMSFSKTILCECKKDPENNQFNLDIADEKNVLEKFSQLFQGKVVSFTDEDLLVSYKMHFFLRNSYINNGNPVFLEIGNKQPVALYGGSDLAAAISSEI